MFAYCFVFLSSVAEEHDSCSLQLKATRCKRFYAEQPPVWLANNSKGVSEDLEKAENGLSRKVPGLKYAHVYRDNWTRLNVRPAKIMQVCTGCCGFLYKIIKTVSCINSDQSGKAISMDVNKWSAQASFHCLSARVTNYAM